MNRRQGIVFTFLIIAIAVTMFVGTFLLDAPTGKQLSIPASTYHKTIEVEVVEGRVTWENTKSHYCTGYIKIKSNKYNLSECVQISNGSPYFNKVYCGGLHQGDKIKAVLYSVKKGDKVVKRYLGELEEC